MKKIKLILLIILITPYTIFAYSKNIIPGGESIGISINTDGLYVVGFYKVNGEYIAKDTIKIGDRITKINNIEVSSNNELINIIDSNIDNSTINVELIRNNKVVNTTLNIEKENNIYKTGLYIKDSIIGLGTLSYIDPNTKIYGALGHEIISNETKDRVEVKDGDLLLSEITSINKSINGRVGSKNANISHDNIIGTINKNTNKGIFGIYTSSIPKKDTLEVASYEEIKLDKAYILTTLTSNTIKEYEINIIDKYDNKKDTQKAFSFEVIDSELIHETGGIVQGMSGSPIIQNNKIIGCVTNVLVDNVTLGYGISIITMLSEGEK